VPKADDAAALRGQLTDLQRDNGILKRAVAIQNARMQARGVAMAEQLVALCVQVWAVKTRTVGPRAVSGCESEAARARSCEQKLRACARPAAAGFKLAPALGHS